MNGLAKVKQNTKQRKNSKIVYFLAVTLHGNVSIKNSFKDFVYSCMNVLCLKKKKIIRKERVFANCLIITLVVAFI